LLLADEPTAALDSASATRALDLLAALREQHGMTVIVVSHDIAVAERADRVLHPSTDGSRAAEDRAGPHSQLARSAVRTFTCRCSGSSG